MSSNSLNNLKKQYEEEEIKPSADLWNRLEAKLDQPAQEVPRAKPSFGWWKYAAAALVLISVGYLILNQFGTGEIEPGLVELQHTTKADEPTEKIAGNVTEVEIVENNQVNLPSREPIKFNDQKKSDVEKLAEQSKVQKLENSVEKVSETQFVFSEDVKVVSPVNINTEVIAKSEPEEKTAENTSYIRADELLFSREIEKRDKKSKRSSRNLVNLDLMKIPRPKPASVKILGVDILPENTN